MYLWLIWVGLSAFIYMVMFPKTCWQLQVKASLMKPTVPHSSCAQQCFIAQQSAVVTTNRWNIWMPPFGPPPFFFLQSGKGILLILSLCLHHQKGWLFVRGLFTLGIIYAIALAKTNLLLQVNGQWWCKKRVLVSGVQQHKVLGWTFPAVCLNQWVRFQKSEG